MGGYMQNKEPSKAMGCLLLCLIVVGLMLITGENRKNRNANDRPPAERIEAVGTDKAELRAGHVMGGQVAIGMKNSGLIRPRGDVLNAVARQAANEKNVPMESRAEFVKDFEWAFNFAWDKSN